MAQKAAWLNGAERVIAIVPLDYRLQKAKNVNKAEVLNAHDENLMEKIREMTGGRGVDCAIDAVGMEAERGFMDKVKATINLEKGTAKVLELCFDSVRRGGNVSVVGVYGSPYNNFPVHQMFEKGFNLRMGQAYVQKYIDELFEIVRSGKVTLDDIITHRLSLSEAAHAYDIFKKKEDDCVKVVLKP